MMNTATGKQYYFIEKPLFIFVSAILEMYFVFKFIPITDVAFQGVTTWTMFYSSLLLIIFGVNLMVQSKID